MTERLVLFDIDGTILVSSGAGRRALTRVMAQAVGDPEVFGKVRFDGKTDPQIIVELLEAAGHGSQPDGSMIEMMCRQYLELLSAELESPDAPKPVLMPGVLPLLDALEAEQRVILGLLTGNLVQGAQLKLGAVGIDHRRFPVGAFGSDSPNRPDLPGIAALRAEPLMGRTPTGPEIVIVGDTPADVTCGQGVGARAVAVATGNYSRPELQAAGAAMVFDDLSDTEQVLEALLA